MIESLIESDRTMTRKFMEMREKRKKTGELVAIGSGRHSLDAGRYYYNVTLNIKRVYDALRCHYAAPASFANGLNFIGTTTNESIVTQQPSIFRIACTCAALNIPFLKSPSVPLLPPPEKNTCLSCFTARS